MNDVTPPRTQAAEASPGDTTLEEFLGAPPASPWRNRRNWIIAGVLLLIVILLLWRLLAGSEAAAYATQEVRRGDLTVSVSATGNLQPTNKVEVGSEQSGLVTDVYVDNNDRVAKGRALARLDTSRLTDQITQNQAALASAQAQVVQAQASAVQAQATLRRQEEVYRLSGGKVPSQTELDTARAENRRAVAGVRVANAQVTQARATLSSSLTNLSKATIYSPVNGVILQRQVDPGQTVAASFQAPVLFTIAEDLSKMKLEVKVDEADVGQVREGQRATFSVDAYPGQTFPAVISRIDVGANTDATSGSSTSANTVVSYIAELAVENPDLMLRPGMTATADIVTKEKRNVLLVPNAALRFNPNAPVAGQQAGVGMPGAVPMRMRRQRGEREVRIGRGSMQTVYILGADGEPDAVRVRVGDTNGSLTEVTGGDLKPGQQIILGKLAPGAEQKSGQRDSTGGDGAGSGGRRSGQGMVDRTQGTVGSRQQDRQNEAPGKAQEERAAAIAPNDLRSEQAGNRELTSMSNERPRGDRFRNMPPEQREKMRETFRDASPEERQRMRERFQARRAEREAALTETPPGE